VDRSPRLRTGSASLSVPSAYDDNAAVIATLVDVGIDHADVAEHPMLTAARCSGGDEDDPA
jgi:hypothetical protein